MANGYGNAGGWSYQPPPAGAQPAPYGYPQQPYGYPQQPGLLATAPNQAYYPGAPSYQTSRDVHDPYDPGYGDYIGTGVYGQETNGGGGGGGGGSPAGDPTQWANLKLKSVQALDPSFQRRQEYLHREAERFAAGDPFQTRYDPHRVAPGMSRMSQFGQDYLTGALFGQGPPQNRLEQAQGLNLGFSDFDRPEMEDFEAFSYRQSGIPRTPLGFDDTYTGEGEPPPWMDDDIDEPLPPWKPKRPEIDDTTVPNGAEARASVAAEPPPVSFSYAPGQPGFWPPGQTGAGAPPPDPAASVAGGVDGSVAGSVAGSDPVDPGLLRPMGTPAGVERAEQAARALQAQLPGWQAPGQGTLTGEGAWTPAAIEGLPIEVPVEQPGYAGPGVSENLAITGPGEIGVDEFGGATVLPPRQRTIQDYLGPAGADLVGSQVAQAEHAYRGELNRLAGERAQAQAWGTRADLPVAETMDAHLRNVAAIRGAGMDKAADRAERMLESDLRRQQEAAVQARELQSRARLQTQAQQQSARMQTAENQLRGEEANMARAQSSGNLYAQLNAQRNIERARLNLQAERYNQQSALEGMGLRQRGYELEQQAARSLADVGAQQQSAAVQAGQQVAAMGAEQERLQQLQRAMDYAEWQRTQEAPADLLSWLQSIQPGQEYQMGYGEKPDLTGQIIGGLISAAPGVIAAAGSDARIKENIELVGSRNGLNLYEFNYLNMPTRWRGVMAQEVMESRPDAVENRNGIYWVDYEALGMHMEVV